MLLFGPWPQLDVWRLIGPAIVLLVTMAVAYTIKVLAVRGLERLESPNAKHVAAVFSETLGAPFWIWVLILGLYLALEYSDLPPRAERQVGRILEILVIISLTIVASRLARNFVKQYGTRVRGAAQVTSLSQNLAQLVVMVLGALTLLRYLGISVVPILTALGVGGLAVALALQDTLSNLFAGFYITMAGQVRPGDYIRLSTGEEGYVTDITWRSTAVRALANNMIIIPNSKLGQAIVTNFHLPERRMGFGIVVGVSYDCDPDHVERVLLDEALGAVDIVPGLLQDPPPNVRFMPGFGDSSLNFTLNCQIAEFADQFLVQHEMRKRILRRFRREGIEMPFPTRTLYLNQVPEAKPEA